MRSLFRRLPIVLGMVVCLLGSGARAETKISLAQHDFEAVGSDSVKFFGDAAIEGGALRLTRKVEQINGAVLYKRLLFLGSDASFSVYFTFSTSNNPSQGGDGFALLLQNHLKAKDAAGGFLGYSGSEALSIEFDTYQNDYDPSNNHVGINLEGNPKSLKTAALPFVINDGRIYHVWVDYDGPQQALDIRVSDSTQRPKDATLSHTVDLNQVLGGAVHPGFSAATGSAYQMHIIRSFFFHSQLVPGGLDTTKEYYVTDTNG
jgi:hypothetical protein